MANLASAAVEVAFPNNRRGTNSSRNMTELAFTRVTKDLIDKTGWVISENFATTAGIKFEFCIKGYYFQVDALTLYNLISGTLSEPQNIYAKISFDDDELVGQNDNDKYTGLDFVSTLATGEIGLLILQKTSAGGYTIPAESKKKFDSDSIEISIDGGLIP